MINIICLLKLLNIYVASTLYIKQQQKRSLHKESNKLEKEKNKKKKCSRKKNHCCLSEMKDILQDLREKKCEIKLLLTTGTSHYNLKGWISDIRKKGYLLVLINPETSARWYIPIDKIAAIYT